MMCRILIVMSLGAGLLISVGAFGQSLTDRIEHLKRRRAGAATPARETVKPQRRLPRQKLRDPIANVNFDAEEARRAFQWWSLTSEIPLVINWNALEIEGIDQDTQINLRLNNVPRGEVLSLLMRQVQVEGVELIAVSTPWYVQVMTKQQANRQTVVRVYDVLDLLHTVPNFRNAPQFDLNEVLANSGTTGSGGGGGGGSSGESIFGDLDREDEEFKTRDERGEEIAQLIRDSIEPELWQANGGQYSSIREHQGRLIVNAPLYVHEQIGIPVLRTHPRLATGSSYSPKVQTRQAFQRAQNPYRSTRGKVAGVQGQPSPRVAGRSD